MFIYNPHRFCILAHEFNLSSCDSELMSALHCPTSVIDRRVGTVCVL
jgi:hypothetical protein